jgi:hypothetical protein
VIEILSSDEEDGGPGQAAAPPPPARPPVPQPTPRPFPHHAVAAAPPRHVLAAEHMAQMQLAALMNNGPAAALAAAQGFARPPIMPYGFAGMPPRHMAHMPPRPGLNAHAQPFYPRGHPRGPMPVGSMPGRGVPRYGGQYRQGYGQADAKPGAGAGMVEVKKEKAPRKLNATKEEVRGCGRCGVVVRCLAPCGDRGVARVYGFMVWRLWDGGDERRCLPASCPISWYKLKG